MQVLAFAAIRNFQNRAENNNFLAFIQHIFSYRNNKF